MWGSKKREIARHVKGYKDGRSLMRQGDGADEWIGMSVTKEHLLALIALGCNEHGRKVSRLARSDVLREHGLHTLAALEKESGA